MIGWKTAGALLCAALLLFVLCRGLVVRRRKIKEQICQMEVPQKTALLNELAEPFGFFYEEREGVFSSRKDAWQRRIGYTAAFDRGAFGACMVLDAFPVYFDYGGKTWLIEFWKGQYGINTGGEVGVYHTEEEIPPHAYAAAHFLAAEDEELPKICCRLERNGGKLYEYCERHWWLTGFRMGRFPSRGRRLFLQRSPLGIGRWRRRCCGGCAKAKSRRRSTVFAAARFLYSLILVSVIRFLRVSCARWHSALTGCIVFGTVCLQDRFAVRRIGFCFCIIRCRAAC